MKRAFVCPGQGSQTPGMGKDIYDKYPAAREVFRIGSEATGVNLEHLTFDTQPEILNRTENAQLAVFTVTLASAAALRSIGITPDAAAGFSLGECSALALAGVYSLPDCFRLVKLRGEAVRDACAENPGAMSAVLGLDGSVIVNLSAGMGAEPVNFNCPGQTVIAGTPGEVEALGEKCLQAGAKRVVPLGLSGAFHTKAMSGAADRLQAFASSLSKSSFKIPVYSNLDAKVYSDDCDIPKRLSAQMKSPVLWQKSVEVMLDAGITELCELAPGLTLTGFNKRISSGIQLTSAAKYLLA